MRGILATVLLALLAAATLPAQQTEIRAGFLDDYAVVGEGVAFVLVVSLGRPIDDDAEPVVVRPELPNVPGLELEYESGSLQQAGQQITIVNGRRSGSLTWSGRYQWRARAAAEGSYRVPAFDVVIDGKSYRCNPEKPMLQVMREAPGNRYVGLAVAVDRLEPYVNQPVHLRWVLTSERLIVESRDSLPEFDVPWAGSPPGFLAEPLVTATRRDAEAIVVRLGEENVRLPRVVREDRDPPVLEISLEKTLVPLAPGTIDLGGSAARFEVAERARRVSAFGGVEFQGRMKAFLRSDPIVLTVRDAPLAGRPASYRGAIGDFDVALAWGDGRIRAGDGVTLNLTLSGSPVVDLIEVPEVGADFPNCRALFSGKESSGEGAERRVTMSWLVKPLDHRMKELPDFRFSWFRPAAERFETASSGVLPLEISGELEEGEIFGGAERAERRAIAVLGEGLRPLVAEPGRMRAPAGRIPGSWFAAVLLLPLLSLITTKILLDRRRALSGDLALQRRRKASRAAEARLEEARALRGQKGFHGKLARCLAGFVADKLTLPKASVAAANLRAILAEAGAPQALAAEAADLLDELDRAEFGGQAGDEAATLARAEEILARLDRELRA